MESLTMSLNSNQCKDALAHRGWSKSPDQACLGKLLAPEIY